MGTSGASTGTITERYDPWTQFARAHLGTAAERSAYLALVGGERKSVSAEDLARDRHLSLGEAEAVLSRFAEQGITDVEVEGDRERYRWREEMDYIFGDRPGTLGLFDPICGMPITNQRPLTTRWDGESYKFCSPLCRAAFLVCPILFATSPHA